MANRGYDVVVDVDEGVSQMFNVKFNMYVLTFPQGDLGHTDLQQDDLEFHSSSMLAELFQTSYL